MYVRHPREQYETIVSLPKEEWKGVDFYGMMYALGITLPKEKEEEIRNEFCKKFFPWRHMAVLMAEDVLYGETPEITNAKKIMKFYRDELERIYPEIFMAVARKVEQLKRYHRIQACPKAEINSHEEERER